MRNLLFDLEAGYIITLRTLLGLHLNITSYMYVIHLKTLLTNNIETGGYGVAKLAAEVGITC